jgi:hypothetical protein
LKRKRILTDAQVSFRQSRGIQVGQHVAFEVTELTRLTFQALPQFQIATNAFRIQVQGFVSLSNSMVEVTWADHLPFDFQLKPLVDDFLNV